MSECESGAGEGADWRRAVAALEGVYSPQTLENCVGVFRLFEAWCAEQGRRALPADPEDLAAYVAAVFGRVRASTVRTRLIEIRRVHELMGFEDPTHTQPVQMAFRRGARTFGTAVQQAYGLNAPLRDRLLALCGPELLGRRDAAMISVGYDTLARASELKALRIEDLRPQPDGGGYILIRRPKTDRTGEPRPAYLSSATWGHISAWLAVVGATRGPLIRPIQHGRVVPRAISTQTIAYRLRMLGRAAGFAPEFLAHLTSHSLRVGAAQDLASSGRTLLEIMLAGRWRDISSVADYTREAQVNVWAPGDGDVFAHLRGVEARVRRFAHRRAAKALVGGDPRP